ncbi:hypothetical protein SLEP1_g19781 [Rubroshorea leprosula]|uniref:Uncharacterized protein n=1 Tax=Rubroshorea leprosula TaxID=152421 RepID=A0AAV5JB47_9ROSI|nr:hypothetical protein SLEP1_g19781 [Rubroshorea leprosula]
MLFRIARPASISETKSSNCCVVNCHVGKDGWSFLVLGILRTIVSYQASVVQRSASSFAVRRHGNRFGRRSVVVRRVISFGFMAGTCRFVRHHVIGSTLVEPSSSRPNRTGAPLSVRVTTKGTGVLTSKEEGPSCLFVGPIETASKETLEALYHQARDSYYSGNPLIIDDMFDRVELKLRWYGSKSVVKYPRCSLRRQSTYSDAEEDLSQVFALASIWILIFALGSSVCLVPVIYTISLAYQDPFSSSFSYVSEPSTLKFLSIANGIFFMAFGAVIGYPLASAAGNDFIQFSSCFWCH